MLNSKMGCWLVESRFKDGVQAVLDWFESSLTRWELVFIAAWSVAISAAISSQSTSKAEPLALCSPLPEDARERA